ncbi:histone-lysine N-methyltransferase 2D-like isoform X9 [Penaeus japonicus]|uniref:histone-lysine N-methyltransferase 2D-like isoform X9 n=1 Tax=Penaeus japonicus TaxID=27405 RepID=UPI001C7162F9|nr:histone-lysine N-methyltransferase 2D-like isoform X9 [Penaeus japonicus]
MGWTTKLFVLSLLGLATCQQRSISGGRRRQRVPAGKSEVANFNCPEDFGYYPHPTDCSQYYVCVFGGALQESCTGGLVYSHELQTCDWPRNVVCNLTQAGSGVSTVRITDPRTRTNPVRPVTEPLTSSVSSFDDRLDNSLRSSQSLRASNAFDSSDKANRQARFFQEKQEPKQQSINSQRFQNPFSDAAVQESNRRFVNTAPVFPSRKELEEEAWAWRDVSARKSHLFRRDLTVLDSTPDFDYRLGEPSFPSAATARFLQESPQHRLQESSPDAAAEASPRNSHSLPLEFRDQGITRRQSRPQGSFSNQGFPHNAFHTQQFSRFPPSNRPPPPNQFHLQSPANPFGNFQHFSPFGETFDTRPFANGQGRQPPSQQQILVQRPQADLSRPRPQGQFRPRPQVDPFRPRPQVDPFRPRPQADPFRPRPHGDPFRPPPETDAFLPRPLPGQFLHPESVVEPFVPEEAKPIAPSNPSQVPPHFVVPGQHPQHPFAPEVPLPPQRQPVFPPPPPESSQFLPRPPHDGHPQFPPPQPGPVFPPQPFDPESHRPFPTTPAPRITTFAPRHTTPAPRPTTFAPRHTTPAPRPTTLTPRHTKPQPVRTTPKPRPTTPAPRPTTPPPRPTSPATIATTPATRPTRRPTTPTSSPTRPARRPVKVTTPKTPFSRQRSTFPPFKKAVSVDSPQNVISLGKPPQIPGTARHPELSRLPASPSQTSDLLPPTPNQLPTHDDQQPSRPRQPTPAPRPVVAPQPTVTPSVDDAFYGDLNFTDADYFYYYDLYDVDYYDNAPTATPAPVRRPATAAPTRRRVAASSSKSFSRGGTARSGSSLPSSNSPTPSSSLRASSSSSRLTASSSRSQPLPSSSSSSSRSRRPSTSSSSSSSPSRGSSSSSSSSSASSGPVAVDNSVPKRSRRPTLKPVSEIAPSGASSSVDIWKYPPRRPAPVRPQPPVDSKATRCDPKVCVLPDCYCGGKDIPGGFTPKETPQIVLLTFDDSVNDLNKELYTELFQNGRKNPNGCPITSTMYVSHEWTDYSQVQNLYADGHEMASHSIQHSFGEQFSIKKWAKEIAGQREIMAAYGGVKMEDVRGMRAPFLAIGGNKMFKMLYDYNFTYDSSMPVYENKPPSWPYTLDYKIFHDCMIPPCPTNSYPGVWQVPMVMWQDLTGGRCSMGDACTTPPDAEGVYKMLIKNFERHYTSNRAPFGLYYHAAWFTTPHHKEGFIAFLDTITAMDDVWLVTNWQLLQWMRDPQPLSTIKNFAPFGCNYPERKRCTSTKVCNVWHKGGVRYMRTCQQCPEKYPWTGNTGVNSPLNDL